MMHDGRVIVEGTPDEIRAQRAGARPLPRDGLTGMSDALLTVEGLNAYYGRCARAPATSRSRSGDEPVAIVGRNGMGKTTLCAAIIGITPPRSTGSIRFAGHDLVGQPSYRIAATRDRLRAAGPAALPVALGRRAPAHGGGPPRSRERLDDSTRLRALPPPRRAEAKRRRAALGRRAADARDRPRAADQPEAPDHGRALRRARAGDHRDADRGLPQARCRTACGFC